MKALLLRDIKLAFGTGGQLLIGIVFFVAVIVMTPFAIGPDPIMLARIGPGMIWIAALLSILLGLDRLFQTDLEDGSLDGLRMAGERHGLTLVIFIKSLAHWIGTVLPLIILSPLLGLMLDLTPMTIFATMLTLICGTPAITLIGAVGAALAATLPRGSLLISVIVLPLTIPVMIFGVTSAYAAEEVGAPFLNPLIFLISLSLFFAVIGPFAAALALKHLCE